MCSSQKRRKKKKGRRWESIFFFFFSFVQLFLWHVRCLLAPWSLCNRGFSPLYAMILALLLRHFDRLLMMALLYSYSSFHLFRRLSLSNSRVMWPVIWHFFFLFFYNSHSDIGLVEFSKEKLERIWKLIGSELFFFFRQKFQLWLVFSSFLFSFYRGQFVQMRRVYGTQRAEHFWLWWWLFIIFPFFLFKD